MAIYTNAQDIMGLYLTPRLERILELVQKGEDIERKDLLFLIDEAGRYETIDRHVRKGDFKVNDVMLDDDFYLHDVLKDLFMELINMHPSKLVDDTKYIIDFNEFGSSLEGENSTPKQMQYLLHNPFAIVKRTQEHLSKSKPDIQVIGNFTQFNKKYNAHISITAESIKEEVVKEITEAVATKLSQDIEAMQKRLTELEKPKL